MNKNYLSNPSVKIPELIWILEHGSRLETILSEKAKLLLNTEATVHFSANEPSQSS